MEASELTLQLHRGRAGLRELRGVWQQLELRLERRRFFHEWGWYHAWLEELEPQPERVLFASVHGAERCLAIVPLVLREERKAGLPLRVLALPEHNHLPLADILCDRDASGGEVLMVLVRGLAAAGVRWDLLRFDMLMDESAVVIGLPQTPLQWRAEVVKICGQIVCDVPWEAFVARLSGNFRGALKNARGRLAKEVDVRCDVAANETDINTAFDAFLKVEASGWKGEAGSAIARRPELERFYRRLVAHYAPTDRLRLFSLLVGGRTIASEFCALDDDTLYLYKIAYDESYSRFAPGHSLIERTVRLGFELGRYRYVSFLGNPPSFAKWKLEGQRVWRIQVYGPTIRGRCLRALHGASALLRRARLR